MTIAVTAELRKELAEVKRRLARLEKLAPDYWPANDDEGELTEQAKRDLAAARLRPRSSYVSLDELERSIRSRAKKVS
jgi:hypothetical protein